MLTFNTDLILQNNNITHFALGVWTPMSPGGLFRELLCRRLTWNQEQEMKSTLSQKDGLICEWGSGKPQQNVNKIPYKNIG